MNFLADQDIYGGTISFLIGLGHDMVTASQFGMARSTDFELLRTAHDQGRLFITRDGDYGALVFVQASGPGVIHLRILPSTQQAVHLELARVMALYTEQQLQSSFVVEPGRHRIRKV